MFMWRFFLDRLSSKENLRRGNILVDKDEGLCPVCYLEVESIHHAFFNCVLARSVWKACYNWLRLQSVLPQCPIAHFYQHSSDWIRLRKKWQWDIVWFAKAWSLWRHENALVFRNQNMVKETILQDTIFPMGWYWLNFLYSIPHNHLSSHTLTWSSLPTLLYTHL